MRALSHIVDAAFAVSLVYLALMVGLAGLDLSVGPLELHSGKPIVPGMIAWGLALLGGFLRGRCGRAGADLPDDPPASRAPWLAAGLAVSAALVAFALWRTAGRGLFKDDLIMRHEAAVLDAARLRGLFTGHSWSTPGFIRPLPELVWWLEYRLHACRPLLCQLFNLGVHLVNVLLVGLIATELGGDARRAAGAMALFAVCGAHAEPLIWLSCRYDLIATAMSLAALAALLTHLRRGDRITYALSLAATALALLSKEAALALPLALALTEMACARRYLPRKTWPHLALLAACLGWRLARVGAVVSDSPQGHAWFGLDKLLELPLAVLAPLGWPFNLEALPDLAAPARCAIGAGLALAPLIVWRRVAGGLDRATALAYALLVLLALPVHNVISFSATLRQSRYVYLPAALFAVLIAVATRGLPARRALLALAALVACNAALLRVNAEPFVAAGAVVERVLADAAPVVKALAGGAYVELRGLPMTWQGTSCCEGLTVIEPVARRAGKDIDVLYLPEDEWQRDPPRVDRRFTWSLARGFVDSANAN